MGRVTIMFVTGVTCLLAAVFHRRRSGSGWRTCSRLPALCPRAATLGESYTRTLCVCHQTIPANGNDKGNTGV